MSHFSYSIESNNLNKTYNKNNKIEIKALVDFNLQIPKGSIYGLLGPNGAGKSTLINTICGILNFNEGKITVNNHDIIKDYRITRSLIGIVTQ